MVGIRCTSSSGGILGMEDRRNMSQISKESVEKLQDLASSIDVKLTFWFDDDYFETEEEVLELIHYCETGEFDDFTDQCIDELLSMIHTEFFDPPYQSRMGQLDRPMGIVLDTNVTYG
jgi:transcriptional regulator with XRE-family HTH domain